MRSFDAARWPPSTDEGLRRSDFRFDLQANYAPRDDCAQYRESEFDVISRPMEQSGIFYYFDHSEDRHTLVRPGFAFTLADAARTHLGGARRGRGRQFS
ncbi:contractile injection system protein, VgrG/Pvc8 family [Nannocystis sp. SCPEA4]|nr:contractile injection system protein, VgrG/Pvc8 family [Nannocystis sp. SCPEA4]